MTEWNIFKMLHLTKVCNGYHSEPVWAVTGHVLGADIDVPCHGSSPLILVAVGGVGQWGKLLESTYLILVGYFYLLKDNDLNCWKLFLKFIAKRTFLPRK